MVLAEDYRQRGLEVVVGLYVGWGFRDHIGGLDGHQRHGNYSAAGACWGWIPRLVAFNGGSMSERDSNRWKYGRVCGFRVIITE